MRRLLLFTFFMAGCACCTAQSLIHFRVSRPMCLFSFLEAAAGMQSASVTYRDSIQARFGTDTAFTRLITDFSRTPLQYVISLPGYPAGRNASRNTLSLIKSAAVQAGTTEEFLDRCIGLVPNTDWLMLKSCMERAVPYYDRMIDAAALATLERQRQELEKLAPQVQAVFGKLKTFYGSTWSTDIPFTVALYPIPSMRGNTTATPHHNSVVMGLLRREPDYIGRMGVGIHEIAHVLYTEQPAVLQNQLDSFFALNPSPYSPFASMFINEGLATVCGNGWAYKMLAGHEDTSDWYNNDYINRFAKALYPMTEDYLARNRTIDKNYIDSAVRLFAVAFPDAPYAFDNLLSNMHFYTDNDQPDDMDYVFRGMRRQYSLSSVYSSAPINAAESLEALKGSSGTQFIVVHTRHAENKKMLQALFPELKTMGTHPNELFAFRDKQQRAIILLCLENREKLGDALAKMKLLKKIDPAVPYRVLD